jgi:hypothetical protein
LRTPRRGTRRAKETVMATQQQYLALFPTLEEAIEFEDSCLNVGREFLPPFASDVLDHGGRDASPAYWKWLCDAQAEHEWEQLQAAVARGEEEQP